jgi:hypothetical protein
MPTSARPEFRGPNRDGVWEETGIVQSFPPAGLKFWWRVPVGPGWSRRDSGRRQQHPSADSARREFPDKCVTTNILSGWYEYADLLLLASMAQARSAEAEARRNFESAVAMWDGQGFADRATKRSSLSSKSGATETKPRLQGSASLGAALRLWLWKLLQSELPWNSHSSCS